MTKFTTKARNLIRSSMKKIKDATSTTRKHKRKTGKKRKKIATGKRPGARKRKSRARTVSHLTARE